MKKQLLFIFLGILLICPLISAQNNVDLVFFYGQGCPHCAKLEIFLEDIQKDYPELNIIEYEVYSNPENAQLFAKMASLYGTEIQGVPTTFIGDKVIAGFSNAIGETIEQEIKRCIEEECISPITKLESNGHNQNETITITGDSSPTKDPDTTNKLSILAVVSAAIVDAINPCAFAVLIILLTTVLATKSKKKAVSAGLAFSIAIFISYFLMGLGLYSAVRATGITHTFYAIVAILAILIGLFNLKDYLWYGKWFLMEVPLSWRPKMKGLLKGVTSVPGAFLIGFVVSLFLLPCTSGPYIVILGLLAKTATKNYALSLLLLYNFIFILPMLIITFAISFGFTTTEKAELWRTRHLKTLHLIAGIIILLLGIGMLIAMKLGWV
jgi:cytochrome c biogenesis protein CcdA/glutaredoxin